MSTKYTFEQALEILEIDATAGPRNAKRALMIQLQRHGPEPSPEDYARFTAAYDAVEDPSAWPDYEAPDTYGDEAVQMPQKRHPPGHQRSQRDRPVSASQAPPANQGWSEPTSPTREVAAAVDNPFLTPQAAQRTDAPPAAADAGVSVLLADEAVVTALARLEKNYSSVLAKGELVQLMAVDNADELTVYLSRLLEDGQVLATGTTVAALLDLMCGDKGYEFLHSRSVVKLLLGVFVRSAEDPKAINVGASIQRAYDRWATASELSPPALDIGTRDGLRVTRSLAALPQEFPPELLAATARAVQRGDLRLARSDFEDWIEAYGEQADGLRRIIARSAPALFQAVKDLFPDREGEEALARAKRQHKKTLAKRAAVVVALALGGWFAVQGDSAEELARKELLDAKRELCDFAGMDHAACVLGQQLLDVLPSGKCALIEPVVPRFVGAVQSMKNNAGGLSSAVDLNAVNSVKRKADKLVIAAQSKCAGI
jgi:hypothetical protein